jgi:hypothetical protein
VIIAKVDADGEGKPLAKKYGVTGYPSMSPPRCLTTFGPKINQNFVQP